MESISPIIILFGQSLRYETVFDNTRKTFSDLVNDLRRFAFVCGIFSNALPIVYLIYAIFAPAGYLWINIALLVPSVLYFIFYVATRDKRDRGSKRIKRITKQSFRRYKLLVRLLNLITIIYGIYAASTHVTMWSIVLAAFTVISLVFQIILELVVSYAERQFTRITDSLHKDMEPVMKPIGAVRGFVGKLSGDGGNNQEIPTCDLNENGEEKRRRFGFSLKR